MRASVEGRRSPRVAPLLAPRASAVWRFGWLPAQSPEPLPDPGGQAVRHLHHYLRFRRPRRSGLRRVNAEERLGKHHGSSWQANSGDQIAVRDVYA
jgi:hypothetical protein